MAAMHTCNTYAAMESMESKSIQMGIHTSNTHVQDDYDEREERNLSDTRAHDHRKLGNGVHIIIVITFVRGLFKIYSVNPGQSQYIFL